MFRKTSKTAQYNIFASPGTLFSGNALEFYEDQTAWHNLFSQQVTMRINESFFVHYIVLTMAPKILLYVFWWQ